MNYDGFQEEVPPQCQRKVIFMEMHWEGGPPSHGSAIPAP